MRLTRRRQQLGVPVVDITKRLAISRTRWSQIENDHTMISAEAIPKLAEILSFSEKEVTELAELRRKASSGALNWLNGYADLIPHDLLRMYGLEQGSTSLQAYSATILFGLVQTSQYASRLIEVSPDISLVDRQRYLDLRMRRQRQLFDHPRLELDLILFEPCLMYDLGSRAVLQDQLNHLLALAEELIETLSIRVLPVSSRPTGASGASSFSLLNFDSKHLHPVLWEEDIRGRLIDTDADLSQFQMILFEQAGQEALNREESLQRIRDHAKGLS